MRRLPQQHHNRSLRREQDWRALRHQYLWLACGLVLVGGFVVAARQQVVAVQYGYQSEELRRVRAQLLEEQQHLLLALEESSSPARLERAALRIGLQPTRPSQIDAVKERAQSQPHNAVTSVGLTSVSATVGATRRP